MTNTVPFVVYNTEVPKGKCGRQNRNEGDGRKSCDEDAVEEGPGGGRELADASRFLEDQKVTVCALIALGKRRKVSLEKIQLCHRYRR